jgi:hypothetical protein
VMPLLGELSYGITGVKSPRRYKYQKIDGLEFLDKCDGESICTKFNDIGSSEPDPGSNWSPSKKTNLPLTSLLLSPITQLPSVSTTSLMPFLPSTRIVYRHILSYQSYVKNCASRSCFSTSKMDPHQPRKFAPLNPEKKREDGVPVLASIVFDVDGTLCKFLS